uniref:Uncharacterized protein n=1 Tax=Branchiostoma floridae TaxID=7739 RepID=C3Y887_BRAFL|eukprot:XP_002607546.1 hypothetical protein BRAFLDRAFT_106495 [Branchiostoma floridae]
MAQRPRRLPAATLGAPIQGGVQGVAAGIPIQGQGGPAPQPGVPPQVLSKAGMPEEMNVAWKYMDEVVSTAVLSNTTMQGLPATPADNTAITEVLETALGSMTLRELNRSIKLTKLDIDTFMSRPATSYRTSAALQDKLHRVQVVDAEVSGNALNANGATPSSWRAAPMRPTPSREFKALFELPSKTVDGVAKTIQPMQNTRLLIGNVYHYIMQSPNRLAECKTLGLFETSGLFEPSPDGYLPVNSPVALIQGDFVVAGNVMAMSVVHLGPSPSYCHPAIVAALSVERLPDMTQYSPVDPALAAFVEEAHKDLTPEEKRLIQMWLRVKDKFNISDSAYHEVRMLGGDKVPPLYKMVEERKEQSSLIPITTDV